MSAQNEQKKSLSWLTFTMHLICLETAECVHVHGQLIDGESYALDFKIQRIDQEAATFLYAGRVGKHEFPPQEVRLPLVPGQPIELSFTGVGQGKVIPPLYTAWEESVRIAQGETVVLIVGQRSEDDPGTTLSNTSLILFSFITEAALRA